MVLAKLKLKPDRITIWQTTIKTGVSKGCRTKSRQLPKRKRQPPRVSGNLNPRLSASFPAKGEMTAPTQEPGKRTRPLSCWSRLKTGHR